MKKIVMILMAASFVGFVACKEKAAEVTEEATEVVTEEAAPAAEVVVDSAAAATEAAPAEEAAK